MCEERSTGQSGIIQSPDENGDGFYDFNIDCRWLITAKEGYVVRYSVRIHDVEDSVECSKDFLLVNIQRLKFLTLYHRMLQFEIITKSCPHQRSMPMKSIPP